MKPKARILLAVMAIVTLLSSITYPMHFVVAGSEDAPESWGEFLNPDGSINWSKLTYIGDVSEPAEWMNIEVPGGIQVPLGEATYSRYITPSGNVLVLPSPATMFMTFLHPVESGFANQPPEMLGSGYQTLAMLTSDYIDPADLQALGYVDPVDFFQAVIEGRENIWSLINANFLMELVHMTVDSGFLVTALWLYLGANCQAMPGGCPAELGLIPTPGGPGDTPEPGSDVCPPATVAYEDVKVAGSQVAPAHPVVVGQDPEKRGVDVEVLIRIPPVIFTWYEAHRSTTCRYAGNGSGSGCPGPGNRYDAVIGADGKHIRWSASMETSPNWRRSVETECIRHVEVFPDYLDYTVVNANLSSESRAWILNDLAAAYPGASLKRPDWQFSFHGPGNANGSGSVNWSQLIPGIQVADPGTYHLQAVGRTTGTLVSSPRSFDQPFGEFEVELLRVTLIEAP